ncbi:MAG TPA: ABC transporter transmembrane domain-containing protein, partial [Gemmatimonadales bacterium]|nr:ABC transporter transmembrane domain-containing protein [Gemmatimonadales bacterium]
MTDSITEAATRRLPPPGRLVRLWPRVRPYRWHLALASVALVASGLLALAFPMAVRYLLDAAFVERDRAMLDRIALALVAIFIVQSALNYFQTYLLSSVGERSVAGLRRELFARLLEMPPGFFAERRTGELTSRLTSDVGLLQGVLSHQVSEFARQILSLVGGVVLLTWLQPRLTLTALAVAPLVVGSAIFFGRRLRDITTGVQDRLAEATGVAEEAFSQIRTVQSFVQEPAERARFADRVSASVQAAIQRARIRGVFFGMLTLSTFGGVTFVLWQGGLLVLEGQLTAGALVSFLLYTITIAASIGALAGSFSAYQEAVGAAERVFEILEMRPEIADPPHPAALKRPPEGRVAFEGVSFRYQDDPAMPWTLEAVHLEVAPGEVVALVGPSGGGKTTLVSLLPRFWDVTQGQVRLDGHDIRSLRLADLRGAIGVVPQEPALFSGTIRENIAYARPGATEAEIVAAAKAAHTHEFVERLPQGYDTLVGERGIKLSGGQRQRVAIARAILKDPAVLILDEATSNLDTESERLIEDALARLLVGRTTLIIAHRLSTVQRADRLVV